MLKPLHTHNARYYEILRPCLFFAVGDRIETENFKMYFTDLAIKSLLTFEFIKIVNNK